MRDFRKYVVYVGFLIIFVGLLIPVYKLNSERRALVSKSAIITEELDEVLEDNSKLNDKIEYFSDPRNLEKELRARFNYRLPYERLIIVIPEED